MSVHLSQTKKVVVIPTYNNPKTIARVAKDVIDLGYELIIVDDGSYTKVAGLVSPHPRLTLLRHEINLGKGQAILTGAKKVKEFGFDYFVSMDGDGQHLASEINKLTQAVKGHNELIIGSRNFNIDNVPTKSKVGRAFHNFWIRLNSGYPISDSLTGFRLYPVSILDLNIKSKRFNFEAEVLVKHFWKHKKIKDVIIECYYPTPEERVSHFDNYKDTVSITLLHLKLFLQRLFLLKGIF